MTESQVMEGSPPIEQSGPGWRVAHSDCIRFLKSLPDESVDIITTDPAYSGMNQHLSFGEGRIVGRYHNNEANEHWFEEFHDTPENYSAFLGECHRVMRRDRHIYLMFDSFSLLTLGPLIREKFDVKCLIVWDKVNLGMGHHFRRRHEHIVFACKGKRPLSRRDIPDVWSIKRLSSAPYPTQKPVEVFSAMLAGSVEPGFTVCDPFAGSGSSAIAALRAGCSFVGCDISERAVSLTAERCSAFVERGVDIHQPRSAVDGQIKMRFLTEEAD